MQVREPNNVLGQPLKPCSMDPVTGYFRDGRCRTGPDDIGEHLVCAVMTDEFLVFSKKQGNDLVTPRPRYNFPGLKAGDRWCLCASRWQEALDAGKAPAVDLEATHERTLQIIDLEDLQEYAVDRT